MKKINWRVFNIAVWTEIVLAYVLPFRVLHNGFEFQVGFPFSFLSVFDTQIGSNPLSSMAVNPFVFLLNAFAIYFVILLFIKMFAKNKSTSDVTALDGESYE